MAVEAVQNQTLSQVPNFDGRVMRRREEVAAIWVESHLCHRAGVCVVELDQLLTANVPDLDGVVCRATGNARAIRVEANGVDRAFMEVVLIDALFVL